MDEQLKELNELSDESVIRMVLADIAACFGQNSLWIEVDQVDIVSSIGVLRSESHAGAIWEVRGRNARDTAEVAESESPRRFLGVKATERSVVIHGLTLITPDPDAGMANPLYQRIIDWDEVYAQLGMLPGRPVSAPPPEKAEAAS